jgi:hypothetical protein
MTLPVSKEMRAARAARILISETTPPDHVLVIEPSPVTFVLV